MRYVNAKNVLPERLFKELQRYVQGDIIYVPEDEEIRAAWGEKNGTKEKYEIRNNEIMELYKSGVSKERIANIYHLSEHSIKKIINNYRSNEMIYDRAL